MEIFWTISNAMSLPVLLNYPRSAAEMAGTAGWISSAYISVLALILFSLIMKLYKKFEGKDLLDLGEYIGGGFGRGIIGIILIVYITFITAVILREFAEDMKVVILGVSPISFVLLFFLIGMIVGAYAGVESIFRLGAVAVPLILIGYIVIIVGVAPYYKLENMMPLLGSGPYDIFVKGLPRVSAFSALIILFIYFPFIKSHNNVKQAGIWSIGFTACNLISSAMAFSLVYPFPVTKESFLPIFQLARLINYGRFFQRVESIFVLIWAMAALLYLSLHFYSILFVIKKTFRLQYYKPLIIPYAILIFSLSLLPRNLMSSIDLETEYFRNYAWLVTFGMTFALLLIALAVKKARRKGEAGK